MRGAGFGAATEPEAIAGEKIQSEEKTSTVAMGGGDGWGRRLELAGTEPEEPAIPDAAAKPEGAGWKEPEQMHDPGREGAGAASTEHGAWGVQAVAGIAAPQESARSATGETDAVMEEAPEAREIEVIEIFRHQFDDMWHAACL